MHEIYAHGVSTTENIVHTLCLIVPYNHFPLKLTE